MIVFHDQTEVRRDDGHELAADIVHHEALGEVLVGGETVGPDLHVAALDEVQRLVVDRDRHRLGARDAGRAARYVGS